MPTFGPRVVYASRHEDLVVKQDLNPHVRYCFDIGETRDNEFDIAIA